MKGVTGFTTTIYGSGDRRWPTGSRWFHWITALLVFAIVPLGWIFAEFKTAGGTPPTGFHGPWPGTPFAYASAHKTIGLIIFVLIIARVLYRVAHRPPALPGSMAGWEKGLAHGSHWLLYLLLLVMPISGYILSCSGRVPIRFLGLFDFPKLPIDKTTGEIADKVHTTAQYVLYALVLLHIGAIVWHLAVKRDGLLDRMLPRQANAD